MQSTNYAHSALTHPKYAEKLADEVLASRHSMDM